MTDSGDFINWTRPPSGDGGGEPRDWPLLKDSQHIEFLLLKAGARPAAKLEDLDGSSLAHFIGAARAAGLAQRVMAQQEGPPPDSRGLAAPPAGVPHTLYLARDEAVLAELVAAEARERRSGRGRRDAQLTSGRLLGYPDCCCRFFAGLERQDDGLVIRSYQRDREGPGPPAAASPLLNFFPPLVSPVNWFPCSLSCDVSSEVAQRRMDLLLDQQPGRVQAILDALPGVTLAFDRFAFVHLYGPRREDEWLHYSSVSDALSFSTAPGVADSVLARSFRRNVTVPLARAGAVRVSGDAIALRAAAGAKAAGRLLRPLHVFFFPTLQE